MATMKTISLRPDAASSVEDLVSRIADLVLERQSLRASSADATNLERNRLELVHAHWALSHALIRRHCPPKADAAAA
jgi:hypothetical protein